jgi:purine-nucleoside phosphorylase
MDYYSKVEEAADYLKNRIVHKIESAVILGTGLGDFVNSIEKEDVIPYSDIPYFPISTVESHSGELIVGKIGQNYLIVLSGRFHYYEGYDMQSVTFGVRVLANLGIKNLYITNVAGGLNEAFNAGDLVMITDHINFMPENPLRGPNDPRMGPRFPDMKNTYNLNLQERAVAISKELKIELKSGVYFALQGPNLETPAEYKFIHTVGGDLVGMSSVPEVIVARHAGLNIFAVSIVSNVCYPIERITETTLEEVLQVAKNSGSKLSKLLIRMITHA